MRVGNRLRIWKLPLLLLILTSLKAGALEVVASGYLSGNDVHVAGREASPAVAYGNGKFLAVWSSTRDVEGAGTDWDLFYSVSNDGGATWSTAALLHSVMNEGTLIDKLPTIATDGLGNWMVAWIRGPSFVYSVAFESDWSWDTPTEFVTVAGTPIGVHLQCDAGYWFSAVAIRGTTNSYPFTNQPTSLDYVMTSPIDQIAWTQYLLSSRKGAEYQVEWLSGLSIAANDKGIACHIPKSKELAAEYRFDATRWTPSTIRTSGIVRSIDDFSIARSKATSDFIVVYSKSSLSDLTIARTASGAQWKDDYGLQSDGVTSGSRATPRIATDPTGNVIVTYSATEGGSSELSARNIFYSVSSDSGYEWSNANVLNPSALVGQNMDKKNSSIATNGDGRWVAAWLEPHASPSAAPLDTDICFGVLAEAESPRVILLRAARQDYAVGDTVEVEVRISHPVTGFDLDNLAIDPDVGVSIGQASLTGTLDSYTLSFPVVAGQGAIWVSLGHESDVTDANGNTLESDERTAKIVVDDSPMHLVSMHLISSAEITSGETLTADLEFSANPIGFDVMDLDLFPSGLSISEVVISGAMPIRISMKLILDDPNAGVTDCSMRLSNGATITDSDANAVAQSNLEIGWSITPDPMVLNSLAIVGEEHLLSGETATAIMTFSDVPKGLDTDDFSIAVPGGVAENIQLSGTGATRQISFVPRLSPGVSEPVTCTVSLSEDATATDPIGNGLAYSDVMATWTVVPAPLKLISLTRMDADTVDSGVKITAEFEFSEAPLGFDIEDIAFNVNGIRIISPKLVADGLVYTYSARIVIEDPASDPLLIALGLSPLAVATNALGNGLAPSALTAQWTVIPKPLRLLSMNLLSGPIVDTGEEVTAELTFSSAPSGISLASFDLIADSPISSSSIITGLYTTTIQFKTNIHPEKTDGTSITCNLSINPETTIRDSVGNPLLIPTSSLEWQVISQPLTVSIFPASNNLVMGKLLTDTLPTFKIIFNRPVINFTTESLEVDYPGSDAHSYQLVGSSGVTDYSLKLANLHVEGTMVVSVFPTLALQSVPDGLRLGETYSSLPVDIVKPFKIEKFAWRDDLVEVDEVAILDVNFVRPVEGLSLESFLLDLGNITANVELAGGPQSYELRISDFSSEAVVNVSLPQNPAIVDEFGMSITETKSAEVSIIGDQQPEFLSITSINDPDDPDYKLRLAFSERVNSLDLGDLDILLEGMVLGAASISEAHFAPFLNEGSVDYILSLKDLVGIGKIIVEPSAAFFVVAEDGDTNSSGNGKRFEANLVRNPPSLLSIERSATNVLPGDNFTASFTFDKEVSGVSFLITHQGTSHTSQSDSSVGTTYTLNLENLQGEGRVIVSLDPSSIIRDSYGVHFNNTGSGISFGVGLPTLLLNSLTRTTPASTLSGPAVFTFQFSEPVVNFDVGDVIVSASGSAAFESAELVGDESVYTLTLNALSGEGSLLVALAPENDVQSLGGAPLTTAFQSAQVTVDPDTPSVANWTLLTPIVPLYGQANMILEFSTLLSGLDSEDDFLIDSLLEGSRSVEVLAVDGKFFIKVGPILEEGLVGIALNPDAIFLDSELNPLTDFPPMIYFIVDDPSTRFNADLDSNFVLELDELLRAIQFYNARYFGCEDGTEDGFAPAASDNACLPHASDYAPQDWILSLGELLRLIQLFNAGGLYPCLDEVPPSEEGYCAKHWD